MDFYNKKIKISLDVLQTPLTSFLQRCFWKDNFLRNFRLPLWKASQNLHLKFEQFDQRNRMGKQSS